MIFLYEKVCIFTTGKLKWNARRSF